LLGRVGLVFQPSDAIAAPQLDVLAINQPPGLLDCFGIVRARQSHESHKVSVAPDEIHPNSATRSPTSGLDYGAIERFSGTSGNAPR
jgi:hypothetical protein